MRQDVDALSPIQPKLLSRLNERLVLRVIQQHGPSTRAEMTKHIGVTFPTAAKAVAALLESRLLEEYEEAGIGRGRPAKRLRLASETAQVLGVALDVDVSSIAAAGFDGVKRADSVTRFATPKTYEKLLSELIPRINELKGDGEIATHGIGVSLPGLIDYRQATDRVVRESHHPERQAARPGPEPGDRRRLRDGARRPLDVPVRATARRGQTFGQLCDAGSVHGRGHGRHG